MPAVVASDADVHGWSVFPLLHGADLTHPACCRASSWDRISRRIAVAVVDTDDDGISVVVVHEIHIVSFLPHSGDTKNFDGFGKVPTWHFTTDSW